MTILQQFRRLITQAFAVYPEQRVGALSILLGTGQHGTVNCYFQASCGRRDIGR